MKSVNIKEFEELSTKGLVLVDFYADWCGPCKMISPVLEEMSNEMTDVTFLKVNVDLESELAQRFSVMSIPTLIVFKDGELKEKVLGFQPKPALTTLLSKYS